MAQAVEVESIRPPLEDDRPDIRGEARKRYDVDLATNRDVVVYRISGAFVFGAAATVGAVMDRLAESPRAYVIDFSAVPIIDSTAAATIDGFVRKARRRGAAVYICGATRPIRRTLLARGVRPPRVRFKPTIGDAVTAAAGRTSAGDAELALPKVADE